MSESAGSAGVGSALFAALVVAPLACHQPPAGDPQMVLQPDSGEETASEPTGPGAASPAEARSAADGPDFEVTVLPILEARCRPCHFPGGKMYDGLPFDDPETIRSLGSRLFTRIKEQDEKAAVEAFLESATVDGSPRAGKP